MVNAQGTLTPALSRSRGRGRSNASPLPLAGEGQGEGSSSGFTLLELIVVIAVIGILATIALPALRDVPKRAREAALRTDLRAFRDVIDQYYGDKGRYPPSLEALVEDGYLRSIPIDPMTKSAETWILIYEEAEEGADDPSGLGGGGDGGFDEEAGPGIIDVRSGSERLALDGTPFSEW